MRHPKGSSFDGLFEEDLEPLGPMAQVASHCWSWCEGWAPQLWPMYDALYTVPDWHHLIDLLITIRDAHRSHQQKAQAD